MRPIQDAFPLLQTPKKIFITTHHKPDGDAIGSMLGLYHYLVKKGHSVTAVSPCEVPDFLRWMPGTDAMLNYEEQQKDSLAALGGGRTSSSAWTLMTTRAPRRWSSRWRRPHNRKY